MVSQESCDQHQSGHLPERLLQSPKEKQPCYNQTDFFAWYSILCLPFSACKSLSFYITTWSSFISARLDAAQFKLIFLLKYNLQIFNMPQFTF